MESLAPLLDALPLGNEHMLTVLNIVFSPNIGVVQEADFCQGASKTSQNIRWRVDRPQKELLFHLQRADLQILRWTNYTGFNLGVHPGLDPPGPASTRLDPPGPARTHLDPPSYTAGLTHLHIDAAFTWHRKCSALLKKEELELRGDTL